MAMSELEMIGGSPNPKLQQIQNNYVAAITAVDQIAAALGYNYVAAIAAVDQIAAALGLTQNKDLGAILEAIADLKDKATKAVECTQFGIEVLKEKVELINAIAVELNLSGDFEDADVLRQVKAERQAKECAMLAAKERGVSLDAIAGYLGFDSFNGELIPIYEAIKELQVFDFTSQHNDNLAQQLAESQATSYKYVGRIVELENELRSLKELANGLQEKLIATKVMASKRLSRIAELEDKSRSLQEPVNIGCGDDHVDSLRYFVDAFKPNALKNFDSDRLTTPELIQIIRSLLK